MNRSFCLKSYFCLYNYAYYMFVERSSLSCYIGNVLLLISIHGDNVATLDSHIVIT